MNHEENKDKRVRAQWERFLSKHKDSWEIVKIENDSKILWKCSCGTERIYAANSGWTLGSKVAVQVHFEEVINRKKRD